MMADLHVNDRRFLQLTKAFSMLGERERERERGAFKYKEKIKMHQVACQIPSMGTANLYEEAKREGRGVKRIWIPSMLLCLSPTYPSLSDPPF
jgi:hypothetical protein